MIAAERYTTSAAATRERQTARKLFISKHLHLEKSSALTMGRDFTHHHAYPNPNLRERSRPTDGGGVSREVGVRSVNLFST